MPLADPGDCSDLKSPKWLEVLENKRKRPHKLAHDIGAGAPCLVCREKCKGLNLHFWRKLCIECKCRKEDHEVEEEEDYAHFEILFGAKKVKRTTLKFNAQNKSFDWIPPNVPHELAVDYLKSIPQSKLPISNSEGARYRKQQLEKQLPLHDFDPNACHELSAKETQEFQKYLDNLKNHVIGQGKIMKYQSPKMLKESYIHDSLSNMMATSEDYGNLKPQGAELRGQLTFDKHHSNSAFSHPLKIESCSTEGLMSPNSLRRPSPTSGSFTEKGRKDNLNAMNSNQIRGGNVAGPKPFFSPSLSPKNNGRIGLNQGCQSSGDSQQGVLGLRTPSSFIDKNYSHRDRQNNNGNPISQDDNCNGERERFPDGGGNGETPRSGNSSGKNNLNREGGGIGFRPCDWSVCREPLSRFGEMNLSSEEVPFVPVRETGRISAPEKLVNNPAGKMEKDRREEEEEDEDGSNDCFPAPPATCQQCLEILNPEEIVVETDRGGNLALWHAKCFVCDTCKELLVDLMYFFHGGKVFCGRHYAEMMSIPRCHACDELIFVKEYTCAEGESYHVRHFCCFLCDQPLGGKQYVPKDNQPICLDCYQAKYGKKCRTCSLAIAAGEQRVSWKELDFHVSPECFRCANCSKSLLGGRFVVKNDRTFCSKECVNHFANNGGNNNNNNNSNQQ